jgi:hypothetical protein
MPPQLPGSSRYRRSTRRLILALAGVVGLALTLPAAHAQEPDDTFYSSRRTFVIPFTTDPNDKRIKQVILHVSEDQGRTYAEAARANAPGPAARDADKQFRYTAPRDGRYWFVVQTQDFDGTLRPPNLNTVQPGVKVCVDTDPPQATLSAVQPPPEATAGVGWTVQDENLKLLSLRLEYRVLPRTDWTDLPIQKLQKGEHDWNPGTTSEIEVRLTVQDKAGNETVKTTRLTPVGVGGQPGATPGTGVKPVPPPATEPARGKVLMVNKRKIQLNYEVRDVGPSDVSTVEVWYTYDTKKWFLYSKNAPKNSPFVVEMEKEGRYGFTLVAKSGVGFGDPAPVAGDEPQIWVEVDETPPAVKLVSVEVGPNPDDKKMTILWTATDRFLATQPVTISYSESSESGQPKGTWVPIQQNIPNDGKYVWKIPDGVPFKMHIRVEAADQAGNIGKDETRQPVPVDLKRPKAVITGAVAAEK